MRQEIRTLYTIPELDEQAQEKAYMDWIGITDYPFARDNEETLNEFAKVFPVRIRDWGYSTDDMHISWEFTEDEDLESLSSIRLSVYLLNNYDYLFKERRTRHIPVKDRPILHKNVVTRKITDNEYSNIYKSNVYWTRRCCPLTGYFMDEEILDPIYRFLDSPNHTDFIDLMDDCLDQWLQACRKDLEYSLSFEHFFEMCQFNNQEFDEYGNIVIS